MAPASSPRAARSVPSSQWNPIAGNRSDVRAWPVLSRRRPVARCRRRSRGRRARRGPSPFRAGRTQTADTARSRARRRSAAPRPSTRDRAGIDGASCPARSPPPAVPRASPRRTSTRSRAETTASRAPRRADRRDESHAARARCRRRARPGSATRLGARHLVGDELRVGDARVGDRVSRIDRDRPLEVADRVADERRVEAFDLEPALGVRAVRVEARRLPHAEPARRAASPAAPGRARTRA